MRLTVLTLAVLIGTAFMFLLLGEWPWSGHPDGSAQENAGYEYVADPGDRAGGNDIRDDDRSVLTAEVRRGVIEIVNKDAVTNQPLADVLYAVELADTGERVDVVRTDESGKATTEPIKLGERVVIRQLAAPAMYERSKQEIVVHITKERQEVEIESRLHFSIKGYELQDDGSILITHMELPIQEMLQNPELPNGCEITSLTSVLNTLGYNISKTEMADTYLPKQEFSRIGGKPYGADPYKAYTGDPRSATNGFFVYAPPIVEAANRYISDAGGTHTAIDISNSSREEIMNYVRQGVPVVIWVTLNLEKPRVNYGWYIHDTKDYFRAPTNLHAVVLHGFKGDDVMVMDPLRGIITRPADKFFQSYVDLGSHAMVVIDNNLEVLS